MNSVKRREQYRDSLREEIIDAARELFVRHGYEATSIRKIADRVGSSPGILYHYFEDKPAIMARVIAETFARLSSRMRAIVDDPTAKPLDRLRRALRTYIDFGIDHPHHYAILFISKAELANEPRIREVFERDGTTTFNCLRSACREAIASGALREDLDDFEELAQTLWASIHGLTSLQITVKGFPFLERSRLTDRLVDVLVTGIQR